MPCIKVMCLVLVLRKVSVLSVCIIYKSSHFSPSIHYGILNISVHVHRDLNIPLEKAVPGNFIIKKVCNS